MRQAMFSITKGTAPVHTGHDHADDRAAHDSTDGVGDADTTGPRQMAVRSPRRVRRRGGTATRRPLMSATLVAVCAATAVAMTSISGSAAPGPQPSAPTPVVVATPAKPTAEATDDRLSRVRESNRSLLPAPRDRDTTTTCVSGEYVTLSVVFTSIFDSLLPSLPASLRAAARQQRDATLADMQRIHVSTLAISDSPFALGADADDPGVKYRTPISHWIVVQLLKIRDGKHNEAIPVGNITLIQAVETAWLLTFAGVLAPLQFGNAVAPIPGSPLTGTQLGALAGSLTYDSIFDVAMFFGRAGLQQLYQTTARSLLNQCVARVTDEELDQAGRAADDVSYHLPVSPILQNIADQVALADNESCAPIGSLSLQRIVSRTFTFARGVVTDAAGRQRLRAEEARILGVMRSTPVPHNLIPADPSDFTSTEAMASLIAGQLPYIGGAPANIILGLSHNAREGNLAATVPLADLTVTKSLTGIYYAYALSLHLFSNIGGLVQGPVMTQLGITTSISPVGIASAVLGLPLTYGLVTFHNVVRSLCLREDDTSGTGLGAEVHRRSPTATPVPTSTARHGGTPKHQAPTTVAPRSSAPRGGVLPAVPTVR
ncbi:hypothetical protein QSJ18_08865 [Gordonia sp. ABSL1-1]|uniref:hypothetical protein n=1 Tax=Gordonia sp. ABSL1-1 TaxID=3053923 RepID=UPI002572C419|nr:hypothetical protein [Gordonia sp. ABSL1-1]MDL9936848.1 hypothetical protein [Gordonia sp. ABSL1-1]